MITQKQHSKVEEMVALIIAIIVLMSFAASTIECIRSVIDYLSFSQSGSND